MGFGGNRGLNLKLTHYPNSGFSLATACDLRERLEGNPPVVTVTVEGIVQFVQHRSFPRIQTNGTH